MKIAVYCGARPGNTPEFQQMAADVAAWLIKHDHELVYGAGNVGLMGIVSDALVQAKKRVTGVIPKFLVAREKIHEGANEIIFIDTMSERKLIMAAMAEAYITLPGGPGTLEEITEMISWSVLEIHQKPCIIFNYNGFFTPLQEMYDTMVKHGFMDQAKRNCIHFITSIEELDTIL